ncbi:MAG: hypothetical protein IVW36_09400 [Dehalococcoidia bacterium]|nr:hypothetical protein [Dehalococcoidia bacterium]
MNDAQTAGHGPDYADRKATDVRIFTPAGVVEGKFHHAPGVRLSDYLRNAASSERYPMLTDVTVRALDGAADAVPQTAPFILISSAHANMIVPIEEPAAA